MSTEKIKVLIVEHSLPFFHVPAWVEVAKHPLIDLTVAYGRGFFTGKTGVPEGIVKSGMGFKTIIEPSIVRKVMGKTVLWHRAALEELTHTNYDVVIQQFETKMVSMWKIRKIQRKRKEKFVLWGIGESLKPTPVLDYIRKFLVKTADAMVFYADANRERYVSMGIDPDKLFVARNLIDIAPIQSATASWNHEELTKFKIKKGLSEGPVLLTVGRMLQRKRMDLLLDSAKQLLSEFPSLQIVVIGDGSEMENLQMRAKELDIYERVRFLGRVSEEQELAPWFLSADLVVAPGQIGHLATHAHAYGVPLVVADDRSIQGPEIDILLPGYTGEMYRNNDIESLVSSIGELLRNPIRRDEMGKAALKRANEFCSVREMASGFIKAVLYAANKEGMKK